MSTFQSSLQRLRAGRISLLQFVQEARPQAGAGSCLSLLVGVVLGLALGLLIGWVVWPVQWQGATLRDVRGEDRYNYMAAVADAYVMYSSPEAAALAQQRLLGLGSNDAGGEFAAAIQHFTAINAPDQEIRVSNLSRLASALGFTPPVVAAGSGEGTINVLIDPSSAVTESAGLVVQGDGQSSANDVTVVGTEANDSAWLPWLLGLLTALALIVGVFYLYIVTRFPRGQTQSAASNGILDDATINARLDTVDEAALRQRARMYEPERQESAPGYVAATGSAVRAADPDGYGFDEEPDDLPDSRFAAPLRVETNLPVVRTQVTVQPISSADDESVDNEEDFEYENEEENEEDEFDGEEAEADSQPLPAPTLVSPPSLRRDPAPPPVAAHRPPVARPPRGKLLDRYMAHYQAGIPAYDETHQVLDPATNKYIGEIGMGVSTKNALLQNDAEHVIALEVWLFDKSDDRNVGTQTRILLSEYAIDHNLEQAFLKERQDDPRPFTAQPGVRFQLEGHSLLLECEIVEATYSQNGEKRGVFQSVKVEMTVVQKG